MGGAGLSTFARWPGGERLVRFLDDASAEEFLGDRRDLNDWFHKEEALLISRRGAPLARVPLWIEAFPFNWMRGGEPHRREEGILGVARRPRRDDRG